MNKEQMKTLFFMIILILLLVFFWNDLSLWAKILDFVLIGLDGLHIVAEEARKHK